METDPTLTVRPTVGAALKIDQADETMLTTVGMVLEAALGIGGIIDDTFSVPSGLSHQLFEPLLRLSRTDGGRLRMTDLAAQCRSTPSAMTRVSDRLVRLGYAERKSCPSDRRGVFLHITPAGLEAVSGELPRHVDIIRREILGVFNDAELATFERLIRRLRDAVHPHATEGS